MSILLSNAAAAGSATGATIMTIAVYAVIIFAMWFFLMRPQKKEQKRVAAMLADLALGDCVLTTSGFYGIIIDIADDTVIVEFGNNKNCRIPMAKSAISRVEKAEMN
ncbi:MAG: preprotein translocase subunit YajC [Lachnospiraceae bacterium]|nr:preprotein translocase subunit YajC [Lachnospiraceae bacterium]